MSLQKEEKFALTVIVGMSGKTNLSENAVEKFGRLNIQNDSFSITIRTPSNSIDYHSKLYIWYSDNGPQRAWAGSANYTRLAFGLSDQSDLRDEILFEVDSFQADAYAQELIKESIDLGDVSPRTENLTTSEVGRFEGFPSFLLPEQLDSRTYAICPIVNSRTGRVHNPGAGMNWGQSTASRLRKDNFAAYIPLPASHREFFPDAGEPFEVVGPDGQSMVCVRQQQDGKAITSSPSAEILGRYLRDVISVPDSREVVDGDLEKFGSNCVVFEKLANGIFALHLYPGLQMNELESRVRKN